MNNNVCVVLGKIFDEQTPIPPDIWEGLVDEDYGRLVAQFGETNYDKPCVGYILARAVPYTDSNDKIIIDDWNHLTSLQIEIYSKIKSLGLEVELHEIKLHFRDNWG